MKADALQSGFVLREAHVAPRATAPVRRPNRLGDGREGRSRQHVVGEAQVSSLTGARGRAPAAAIDTAPPSRAATASALPPKILPGRVWVATLEDSFTTETAVVFGGVVWGTGLRRRSFLVPLRTKRRRIVIWRRRCTCATEGWHSEPCSR